MTLWMLKLTTFIAEPFNPILNVFGFYTTLTVVNEANALMDAVEAQLIEKINAVCSTSSYIGLQEVIELNGTGFGLRSYATDTYPGARPGASAPPFTAWSYKLVRSVQGTRSGGKRFGLVSNDDVNGRGHGPDIGTAIDDLADTLKGPLNVGLVETWFPVILERPVAPSTVWGQHAIGGAYFESCSTQNTRKK